MTDDLFAKAKEAFDRMTPGSWRDDGWSFYAVKKNDETGMAILGTIRNELWAVVEAADEAEKMLADIGRDYPGRGRLGMALSKLKEKLKEALGE